MVPACRTQDAVSIFALTVADAAKVAMTAIAFDKEDPFARLGAPSFAIEAAPQPLRVGVPNGPIPFFGDKDYESLYHAAIARLAALGARIVPVDYMPFAKAAAMLYGGPWVAERLAAIGDLATEIQKPSTRWCATSLLGAKAQDRGRDLPSLL